MLLTLPASLSTSRSGTPSHRPWPERLGDVQALHRLEELDAVLLAELLERRQVDGVVRRRACAALSICVEPSLTISSRQVSGVRRALTRSSPLSVCGLGLPRLTSRKSGGLVR